MSLSSTTYIYFGHPVRTMTEKPNPRFGKMKFDPETGHRIDPTTQIDLDVDRLARDAKVDFHQIGDCGADLELGIVGWCMVEMDYDAAGELCPTNL